MKVFLGFLAMVTVVAAQQHYNQGHNQGHYQESQHYQEPQQQHYSSYDHHDSYHHSKKHIPIVKSEDNRNHDGSYNFKFETGNGIHAQEHGFTKNFGHKDAGQVAEGSYSYTGDDGVPVGVKYIADEHGFRAEGSHIPTPPPIPHELKEAFAKAASNPHQHSYHDDGDDGQYSAKYEQEEQQHYATQHQPQAQYSQHQPAATQYHQGGHHNQHQYYSKHH